MIDVANGLPAAPPGCTVEVLDRDYKGRPYAIAVGMRNQGAISIDIRTRKMWLGLGISSGKPINKVPYQGARWLDRMVEDAATELYKVAGKIDPRTCDHRYQQTRVFHVPDLGAHTDDGNEYGTVCECVDCRLLMTFGEAPEHGWDGAAAELHLAELLAANAVLLAGRLDKLRDHTDDVLVEQCVAYANDPQAPPPNLVAAQTDAIAAVIL
jgi:hypothetical protein